MKRIVGALLALCVGVNVSAVSGCVVEPGQEVEEFLDEEGLEAESELLWASERTVEQLSVVAWQLEIEDAAVFVRGLDEEGVEVAWVKLRQGVDGKEIATSHGGLVRLDSEGNLLEVIDDPELFAAFVRDTEDWRAELEANSFRSCSVFDWILCSAAVIKAITVCGPFGLACATALLGTAKCVACFVKETGGGGGDGGGGGVCIETPDSPGCFDEPPNE